MPHTTTGRPHATSTRHTPLPAGHTPLAPATRHYRHTPLGHGGRRGHVDEGALLRAGRAGRLRSRDHVCPGALLAEGHHAVQHPGQEDQPRPEEHRHRLAHDDGGDGDADVERRLLPRRALLHELGVARHEVHEHAAAGRLRSHHHEPDHQLVDAGHEAPRAEREAVEEAQPHGDDAAGAAHAPRAVAQPEGGGLHFTGHAVLSSAASHLTAT